MRRNILKGLFSSKERAYEPTNVDHPAPLESDGAWRDTAILSASSAIGSGLVSGPTRGVEQGLIEGAGHRIAYGAAWDEYYRMQEEAAQRAIEANCEER